VITNRLLSMAGIVLLLSALAVIYSKYYSRLIFIEIQKQEGLWINMKLNGADAIGVDDVGGAESGRASGAGEIEAGYAITRKNYLYKTVNDRFSS